MKTSEVFGLSRVLETVNLERHTTVLQYIFIKGCVTTSVERRSLCNRFLFENIQTDDVKS